MCADCSAYSNHSGICPQCRLEEYKKELPEVNSELARTIWTWVGKGAIVLAGWIISIIVAFADYATIGLIATAVGVVWSLIKIPNFKKMKERKAYLEQEIAKISESLTKGTAII